MLTPLLKQMEALKFGRSVPGQRVGQHSWSQGTWNCYRLVVDKWAILMVLILFDDAEIVATLVTC